MKICDYCGRENSDEAIYCRECGTQEFKNPANEAPEAPQESEVSEEPEPELNDPHIVAVCDYCGRENIAGAVHCRECGTVLKSPKAKTRKFKTSKIAPTITAPEAPRSKFRELTAEEMKLDLVTLLTCRTLVEADLVVGRLAGAGISAFIPDEFLAQAMSWNVNAFGYVRVQISPNDYERAKTLLLENSEGAEQAASPNGGPGEPPGNSGGNERPPSVI
jgi:ribosomal protein L40E